VVASELQQIGLLEPTKEFARKVGSIFGTDPSAPQFRGYCCRAFGPLPPACDGCEKEPIGPFVDRIAPAKMPFAGRAA
jgi:hypothetical protein